MKDAFYTLLIILVAALFAILPLNASAQKEIVVEPTYAVAEQTEPGPTEIVVETQATEPDPTDPPETEPELTEPPETEPTYTDEELDLLARIIHAEAGSNWIPDEVQLYVGSVVLNRVNCNKFPDTIKGVIYQKGQYSPTWNGAIKKTPSERAIKNAKYLLENGSILPDNVVFQANFRQGSGVHYKYYDSTLGTTTYFCYI